MKTQAQVHLLRASKRRTLCGRLAHRTQRDTRDKKKVTCRTCLAAIEALLEQLREIQTELALK